MGRFTHANRSTMSNLMATVQLLTLLPARFSFSPLPQPLLDSETEAAETHITQSTVPIRIVSSPSGMDYKSGKEVVLVQGT